MNVREKPLISNRTFNLLGSRAESNNALIRVKTEALSSAVFYKKII